MAASADGVCVLGEGALIAMKGSSLGVGTDTGMIKIPSHLLDQLLNTYQAGSIRVPAAFCGLYGVKPTHDRFSYKNVANTVCHSLHIWKHR